MNNKFKHIVIGSGAGGSVVSLELSKKGENVALVEEGKKFDNSFFKNNNIATRSKNLWRNNGLTPIFGSPLIAYVEGVALGGTTVSNGGALERASSAILDNFFTQYNISGYSNDELKKIYEEIETKLFVKKYLEPKNNIDSTNIINVLNKQNISYKFSSLAHNDCKNSNQCISGCPTGAKMTNLSLTYIPEALNNGLSLFTGSKVVKIFRRNGLYALKIIKNKKILNLYCEKLYISAGPIQSPFIILKNGLHKSAGKKINFHLNYKIGVFFSEKTNAKNGTIHIIDVDHYKGEGFSIVPANFQNAYFFSSFPNFSNKEVNYIEKEIDHYAMYTVQIQINGYARIVSSKTPDPIVHYKLMNNDIHKIKRSLKIFAKLLFDSGAKKLYFSYDGDYVIENLKDLENFISGFDYKKMSYVCAHVMGSCKMSNNSDGIVDDSGNLKNNHNIIVADNSILPESIGDSPQLTTMAFVHQIMNKQLN
jgi:hypothetical protein